MYIGRSHSVLVFGLIFNNSDNVQSYTITSICGFIIYNYLFMLQKKNIIFNSFAFDRVASLL